MVSVTGILAFYQTKVPFHRQGQVSRRPGFLRRLLRRRQKARHARDRAHESRPQLGGRRQSPPGMVPARLPGQAHPSREDPRLFRTCMFSTYMTDYMPAIMREDQLAL